MKKIVLIIITLVINQLLFAQIVPIFQWSDHLSYKNGLSVAEGNGRVYCATKSGFFTYNKNDNSLDRLSKINGLSDVDADIVNFNHFNNKVMIAYSNSNVDIIDGTSIINIADIKNKNMVGDKSISNIYFINQYAYLACGFGIVVIDMNRLEISDTYYIGPSGTSLKVYDITSDNTYIYAATATGVYKAFINSANLADFNSWHKIAHLPTGKYNTIATFHGKIYVNRSKFLETGLGYQDTLKVYNPVDSSWSPFYPTASQYTTRQLKNSNNKLILSFPDQVNVYDSIVGFTFYNSLYLGGASNFTVNVSSSVLDVNNDIWIADGSYGLVCWRHGIGSQYHYPNGPSTEKNFSMSLAGGNLMVVPGGFDGSRHNTFNVDGIYYYTNKTWSNIKGNFSPVINLDSIYDIVTVLVDTIDPKHAYVGCWGFGIIELYNGIPIKHYNSSNTNGGLQAIGGAVNIDGLALDGAGNLWVCNNQVRNGLAKKTPAGVWSNIDMYSLFQSGGAYMGPIIIDKNDQKWIVNSGTGLLVCAAGYYPATNSSNSKLMNTAVGNGALPSLNVYCLAEDQSGEIWVGTDKGISVFYSPENVFVPGQTFDSQQILLEQDGQAQILLLTETVQAIAVDDANRKWIGTSNSGVFLMSADGTQQIYHFDASNSPLFSNNVQNISINHKTGEVYFGTDKGIIEFRGSSTAGAQDCSGMYAFPNPVKPNYDGPIAITGLVNNSTIKITDVTGTLVYQMVSEGGQALWYGKNFKGEKVATGVYMVFCTNSDGTNNCVSKILFVN